MNLNNYINNHIGDVDVSVDEFGDIAIYLLDTGVICRDDSKTERDLYDKFVRVKEELMQYLSILGIHLYHNEEFFSIRAYAPDSVHPNSEKVFEDGSSLMRLSINKELAASLLISYLLYEQYRSEARLKDDFTAVVEQHEFVTAHATMLGIDIVQSGNKNISTDTYKMLKKLRAVNYHPDFFSSDEYPLIIRPFIYDIVPEENLQTIEESKNNEN